MNSIEYFEIFLDNNHNVFMTGDLVKGNLVVKLNDKLKVSSLKTVLKGEGKVHWTDMRSSKNLNGKSVAQIDVFSAEEEYLNTNVMHIPQHAEDDCILMAGHYSFPFELQLPQHIPTSFEYIYGQIRYTISGNLTTDTPTINKIVKLSISVIRIVDLNLNLALRQPSNAKNIQAFNYCCFKKEPIEAKLLLFKGAFVPGENLMFNAIITNKSSINITNVIFRLIQTIVLRAKDKTNTFKRVVIETAYPKKIPKQSNEEWKNVLLLIPSICPTSSSQKEIINISYYVSLELSPEKIHKRFNVTLPVTIGTIPFKDVTKNTLTFEASALQATSNDGLNDKGEEGVKVMNKNFIPFYLNYKDYSNLS